jgi:predicted nucleic acid-binding protein
MLLDTNVYSALARGVQSAAVAINHVPDLEIPLPVIAELRYGFLKGSQKDRNEQMLQKFLAQPHITVVAPTIKTTTIYAELQLHCRQRGKALSQNDIWIAALATEANDVLVTFDADFSVFADLFGEKLILLE